MIECYEVELTEAFQYSCGAPVNGMRFSYPDSGTITHQLLKVDDENLQLQKLTEAEFFIDFLPHKLAVNIIERWHRNNIIELHPYKVN